MDAITTVDARGLAPVRGKARIDVLDILRGLAILGILFINVPYMAAPVAVFNADVRAIGWTLPDRIAWSANYLLWSGTQRAVLQFLFGAAVLILARKAMEPDGPVAVSDLYYRRNLWLLVFGCIDAVLLFWPGDILHIYAIAALFLFPFRRVSPKLLLAMGMVWPLMFAIGIPDYGAREYVQRTQLVHEVSHAVADQHAGRALTRDEDRALADWRRTLQLLDRPVERAEAAAAERAAHSGSAAAYAKHYWLAWRDLVQEWLVWSVIEAVCAMMIGMALWKWGVIQGQRSKRFYLTTLALAYGIGFTCRGIGLSEVLAFGVGPRTIWITGEGARLAIGLGHVALINYAVQTRLGEAILRPFKATGRVAFSLYFLQQFIGMWVLFAPWGLNLWGRFGWAQMTAIACAMVAVEVMLANLWLRRFANGPLEWLWRSLAYGRPMPMRRTDGGHAASEAKLASIPSRIA
ncbi:DUF418 domain-containing protein [Hephaestia sp. GCM10023244]|uniref:DUF418 domain-containing protein n=1 Tax=unclassified Hephaestia TaxID=2631281 RepID=UPI0020775B42|nr:DUF418 domain-containing protein [Hephaestia sp. MAHUQ-44]MCM8730328.1 DUF418 domain-containing protein [Hephaestia sp. MAHUQ-44]